MQHRTVDMPTSTLTLNRRRWLVEHRMVEVLTTSAGGVEEDLIKCLGDTYLGDWAMKGGCRVGGRGLGGGGGSGSGVI